MDVEKVSKYIAMNLLGMSIALALAGRGEQAVVLWLMSVFFLGITFGIKSAKEAR